MATMNISLPARRKARVEARVADADCANVSDYVRDLIRRDLDEAEREAHFRLSLALSARIYLRVISAYSIQSWGEAQARRYIEGLQARLAHIADAPELDRRAFPGESREPRRRITSIDFEP